jgi:hypothetical protein
MNGAKKFHKPTGPAFNVGEVWRSLAGNIRVVILGVRKYANGGNEISDFAVRYDNGEGVEVEKDAWNFQVRYQHQADQGL